MNKITKQWYTEQTPAVQAKFRQWLKETLQEYEVHVVFRKADGELRDMKATLKTGIVPLYERKTDRPKKPANIETCAVYDLNKKEWRSFRYDRLVSVRYIRTEYGSKDAVLVSME
jgi:WYL_2, Sm-like SH3 beta-barrel fold